MPPISVLMKPASSLCNMSCEYCFYCDEARKRTQQSYGFMSEGTLKNIIRKTMLRAEGMISYVYQGGEPTLRGIDFFQKAVAYQQQYNKNHIRVLNALQTNGYMIDEEWCRFLHDNHFLVGLSVDGIPDIHNSLRHTASGESTYERILATAELLDRFEIEYNILTVVTPQIASNISSIYTYYQKHKWNYQQYIACLDPLDEPHGQASYALKPEIYGQFLINLFELWYADLQNGKQPFIRQFENYVGLAIGRIPESCEQRGTCGIQYVAEADGSVYPCDFYMLDEYRLGNFNEDRLDIIDERRRQIAFLERSYALDPACLKCPYYFLCRGGCQRNRDQITGTEIYKNYFCKSYRMFFEHCYEQIMSIGKAILRNS